MHKISKGNAGAVVLETCLYVDAAAFIGEFQGLGLGSIGTEWKKLWQFKRKNTENRQFYAFLKYNYYVTNQPKKNIF